jgi:hypothetical protein
MSLIELVIGMALMVIFLTMFTGAVVMMNRSHTKAESVNATASQLQEAFLTLDKTVRYAAAISAPGTGTTTGDWYVELRTTNTGREMCSQVRVDVSTQQLQRRTWQVSGSAASNLSAWRQVAATIVNGGAAAGSADQPFALKPLTASVNYQQLAINLVSSYGSAGSVTTSRSSSTFTAVNSTAPPPAAPICQEVGRP